MGYQKYHNHYADGNTMITISYNNKTNKLKIVSECMDTFTKLREHFSCEIKGASFAKKINRFAQSKKYAITPTGLCTFGLISDLKKYFIENQIIVKFDDSLALAKNGLEIMNPVIRFTGSTGEVFELRDYQKDLIESAIKVGRGICVLGTGGGKTLATAALIQNYYNAAVNKDTFRCIVLVPDIGLVQQTYSNFIEYGVGFTVTKWSGDNELDMQSNVVVCNIKILQTRFNNNEWIKYIDLLIVDEVHKLGKDNKVSELVESIETRSKFGLTGTMPTDKINSWNILKIIGPEIYTKHSKELRAEGYLTAAVVDIINIKYKDRIKRQGKNKYFNELSFLYNNEFRNTIIKKLANDLGGNTLILVNHLEHGEALYNTFSKSNTYYINGSVEVEERERIKQLLESNTDINVIAMSSIFSTGINVKKIHNVIFGFGGKAFIRIMQSIGRGLRLHDSKKVLRIIDICDVDTTYSQEHMVERIQIYKSEGFKIREKYISQP